MFDLPEIAEHAVTFYSVIPLPLDTEKYDQHLQHISAASSDCLIITAEECNTERVTYFNTPIELFANSDGSKKEALTTPFTSLIVGPSYSCNMVMEQFCEWFTLHQNSYTSPALSKKHSLSPSKDTPSSNKLQGPYHWQQVRIPKVWAQATLSHVKVTCAHPASLKKELRSLFQYPITVTPVSPTNSETHNELLAWIFAVYAVAIARKIFRTVLCHHSSIESYYSTWTSNPEQLPPAWKLITQKKLSKLPTLSSLKQKSDMTSYAASKQPNKIFSAKNWEMTAVLEHSEFATKRYIYSQLQDEQHRRYIGLASEKKTFQYSLAKTSAHSKHSCIFTLQNRQQYILLSLPLIPSLQSNAGLKSLLSRFYVLPKDRIFIEYFPPDFNPFALSLDRFDVLANLLLLACKKQKAEPKWNGRFCFSHVKKLQYVRFATMSVELHLQQFSRKLELHKIDLGLHIGKIADVQFLHGILEYELHNVLFALLGTDAFQSSHGNYWHLHLHNVKNNTSSIDCDFVAPISDCLLPLMQRAIDDGFAAKSTVAPNYPIMEDIQWAMK